MVRRCVTTCTSLPSGALEFGRRATKLSYCHSGSPGVRASYLTSNRPRTGDQAV